MNCLTVSCYFWEIGCRIDWAAWVQAIFIILALAITHYIATRNERNRRYEILMAANTFASQLLASFAALRQYSEQNRRDELTKESYVFHEVILLGRSIPIELLSKKSGLKFFRLRAISAEGSALIEEIRYINNENLPITEYRDKFEALRDRAQVEAIDMNM